MTVLSRRDLLGASTAVAVTAALPAEAKPRSRAYGDLRDIKHSSSEHAGEPQLRPLLRLPPGRPRLRRPPTILLPGRQSVCEQPTTPRGAPTQYPWRLSERRRGAAPVPSRRRGRPKYGGTSTAGTTSTAPGTAA